MTIHLNGEPREVNDGISIVALLNALRVATPHVAVELNLEVVPRAEHALTMLHHGDRLEVVTLVGGG